MDLLQLEHFLAVVEERTFTRAAERVCRTQPAVSQSIKKLEEEVGAPLFARDVHEVSLTEAGRVLADYARRMVGLRDEAMRQVAELKTLKAGTLTIAAHESAAVYLLPAPAPHLPAAVSRHQGRDLSQPADRDSPTGDGPRGRSRLRQGRAGVSRAAVGRGARRPDDVHRLAAPSARAARQTCSVRDLGAEQFVLHHLCSATADTILRLFEQHATRCRIVAELWSFENIKSFVQEEVGLAIVPGVTVRQELGRRHARADSRCASWRCLGGR